MNYYDLYELIEVLCEEGIKEFMDINGCIPDKHELEDIFYLKFDIDIEQFYKIVECLLPLCNVAKSELTDLWYRGFGKDGLWLVKEKIQ